jgi:hypothetical protein
MCCACGGGSTNNPSIKIDKIAGQEIQVDLSQLEPSFEYPPSDDDLYAQPELSIKLLGPNEAPMPEAGKRFLHVDELMLDENSLTKTGLNDLIQYFLDLHAIDTAYLINGFVDGRRLSGTYTPDGGERTGDALI